jgi:energy-coupling factor transporter transmembrane protein EcfT
VREIMGGWQDWAALGIVVVVVGLLIYGFRSGKLTIEE